LFSRNQNSQFTPPVDGIAFAFLCVAENSTLRGPGANGGDRDSVAAAPVERALRILLADDSADSRMLIRAYLRKSAWRVDEAGDGGEALEMFKREHYDAVLMDMQMPAVDGYQATRAIRQWEGDHGLPHTPVFALSGSALDAEVALSLAAGCDAHITKPAKKAALLAAILDAVKAHQERTAAPWRGRVEES
jgi:CheY-like chemotaxis protein